MTRGDAAAEAKCVQAACGCVRGNVRSRNEDNFYFNGIHLPMENDGMDEVLSVDLSLSSKVTFAVFDGMGGEAFGDEAAFLSAQTLAEHIRSNCSMPGALMEFCYDANEKLCQAAQSHAVDIVGSTAAILCFDSGTVHVANVGDSKIFLLRNGQLGQLSRDHNDLNLQKLLGGVRRRPRLTQFLGISSDEMIIEPYAVSLSYKKGDKYLICSDGLTDSLCEQEIEENLRHAGAAVNGVKNLIARALSVGGRDNISVIYIIVQ